MGKYRVKEPVAYVEGNKVVHHLRPAEFVTIDDKTAGELGDAVEPMDKPKAAPKAAEKS
jgi:hypothetical protein